MTKYLVIDIDCASVVYESDTYSMCELFVNRHTESYRDVDKFIIVDYYQK